MYQHIIETYKEFVAKTQLEKTHDIQKVNISIDNYAYIDPSMRDAILKTIKYGNLYTFTFADVQTTLTIAGVHQHPIERFLLYYTCFLIYLFKKRSPLNKLDITLIYYNKPKRITRGPLTPLNVNGGVTSSSSTEATIVVYRSEEIVKVLTHEMIHAFGLDAKDISSTQEDFINKAFNITCKSATLNESFTDALACYINTVMYTYLQRPTNFTKAFARNLKKETDHIIQQAEKVLVYNGYYKEDNTIKSHNAVCEHTHVTSYYVIKAAIYTNLDPFVKMLNETNMHINVTRYLDMIRGAMPLFLNVITLDKTSTREKNLNMTTLDLIKIVHRVKTI